MRLAFLVRDDFFSKFGGDTYQVQHYTRYMERVGCNIDVLNFEDFLNKVDSAKYDCFVVVNLDTFTETYRFSKSLKKLNVLSKTFYLTIHHQLDAINSFNRKRFKNKVYFLSRFLGAFFIDKLKYLKKDRRLFLNSLLVDLKTELRVAINASAGIIAIAEGEYNSVVSDFSVSKELPFFIVRNGVEASFLKEMSSPPERDIDVLVCGRIEERKNQLKIAEELKGKGIKVTFVGNLNHNNKLYAQKFLDIIEADDYLTYIGGCSPEDVHLLYLRSKVHLSASFFEVSSLVDLESYYSGCFTISSKNGYSNEILKGEGVSYLNPSIDSIYSHVCLGLNKFPDISYSDRVSEVHTWDDSSREFYNAVKNRIVNIDS